MKYTNPRLRPITSEYIQSRMQAAAQAASVATRKRVCQPTSATAAMSGATANATIPRCAVGGAEEMKYARTE
jgi:hypothetical protein